VSVKKKKWETKKTRKRKRKENFLLLQKSKRKSKRRIKRRKGKRLVFLNLQVFRIKSKLKMKGFVQLRRRKSSSRLIKRAVFRVLRDF
jgi:hypothetical protein